MWVGYLLILLPKALELLHLLAVELNLLIQLL